MPPVRIGSEPKITIHFFPRHRLASALCALAGGFLFYGATLFGAPNVILVMTDDQGYKDIAAHGHPYIQTPNLDRLHAESVRATDFHVRPTCTPTRAALMTGRDPIRSGIWHTIMGRSLMRGDELTMAETFRSGGYATALFGKWHLGDNHPMRPQDQGFDYVVQHLGGGITQGPDYWGNDYFDDHYLRNGVAEPFQGFCTDIWFDEAMSFVRDHREQPFFIYLALNAPHHPWNVAEKYKKPYLEMGVAESAAPYYALITNFDENMGRLLDFLDELDLAEDTLLLFTTDNGPAGGWPLKGDQHTKPLPNYTAGMSGAKGSCYEGGHRVPLFLRWPAGGLGGGGAGRDFHGLTLDIDLLPTLAEICNIQKPEGPPLDGISFAKDLLAGASRFDAQRFHVIQTQRRPLPSKEARSVILENSWRLVLNAKKPGQVELYDVDKDLRQTKNLASSYPDQVARMQSAYDLWWESQQPAFKRYSRISLGRSKGVTDRLMSHDWLTDEIQECVWSQAGVQAGQFGNGPWAVEVMSEGTYTFELRRWPRERPGPLEADQVKLQIGDQVLSHSVDPDSESAMIELDLSTGPMFLKTWLTSRQQGGKTRGAYYVYVTRN